MVKKSIIHVSTKESKTRQNEPCKLTEYIYLQIKTVYLCETDTFIKKNVLHNIN